MGVLHPKTLHITITPTYFVAHRHISSITGCPNSVQMGTSVGYREHQTRYGIQETENKKDQATERDVSIHSKKGEGHGVNCI